MEKGVIIFTDLDGTLLDKNYSYRNAQQALKKIKKENVPLIICTSKTRAEVEVYRKKLKNKHPFIIENGGAIFIPKDYFSFKYNSKKISNYSIIELGTPYKRLVMILKKLKNKIQVRGFSDMSVKELSKDSGLSIKHAKLAKKREYDEPVRAFGHGNKIKNMLKKFHLHYIGCAKYSHILGNNNKGKAVKILTELYRKQYREVKTIGIGNDKNDFPMLLNVDKPFIVQQPNKKYATKKFNKVKGISSKGFNKLINSLLEKGKLQRIYDKSLEILEQIQIPNGGCLASPPGKRYPYIYPRDHCFITLALISAGRLKQAKKALLFILKTQKKDGSFPQRVDQKGKDVSYKPLQLDTSGLVLYSLVEYYKKTKKLLKKKKIKKAIKFIEQQLNKKHSLLFTSNSVHEFPPYEKGLEVWSNSICCSALLELEKLKFKSISKKIKKGILQELWNPEKNYFNKNIRLAESSSLVDTIDISAYTVADFNILKDDNLKIKKTVKAIEKQLWHKKLGGICRYPKYLGRHNGGFGPWPLYTLMLCRHFIRLKNKKQADKYLKWIEKISYNNLLPEHIATKQDFEEYAKEYKKAGLLRKDRQIMVNNIRKHPLYKKGFAYSVLPLSWAHAEFIRTFNLYKQTFL